MYGLWLDRDLLARGRDDRLGAAGLLSERRRLRPSLKVLTDLLRRRRFPA